MQDAPDAMAHVPLLADLSREERECLAAECSWRRVRKGETVLSRGDTGGDLFFCVEGSVEVTTFSLTGREVHFAHRGPGSYLGELAAIDGQARSATAIAASDAVIAKLPRASLRDALWRHPDIAWRMLGDLAEVVRTMNERVIDMNTLTAHQRVIRELLHDARPSPVAAGQWIIEPAPTQATIAARADTSRETVARVLRELRDGGLVVKRGRCLTVRRRDTLEDLLHHLEK
jgi:CRP-like cAMP-binding protein